MSQRSLRFVSFDLLTPSPLIGRAFTGGQLEVYVSLRASRLACGPSALTPRFSRLSWTWSSLIPRSAPWKGKLP